MFSLAEGGWGGGGPEHPNSGFGARRLPVIERLEATEQAEKRNLPPIPSEEAIDDFSARPHDLGRDIDDGVAISREVHTQQSLLLSSMLFSPTRRDGQ